MRVNLVATCMYTLVLVVVLSASSSPVEHVEVLALTRILRYHEVPWTMVAEAAAIDRGKGDDCCSVGSPRPS